MKKILVFGLFATGVLGAAAPAQAQLAVEVRGGAAFPMGDFKSQLSAETGVNYGVNATFQAIPMLGIYAGFERAELGVADAAATAEDLTDQGFVVGGKLTLPFGGMLGPWIRAGAVWNELTGGPGGGATQDSRGLGFEAGGGIAIPLGMVITVTPGVRYRTYASDRVVGGDEVNVSYLVADLGMSFRF